MLTGKAKEDFEKWYLSKYKKEFSLDYLEMTFGKFNNQYTLSNLMAFKCSPFSMQYGVYVDFFDSVGIHCSIYYGEAGYWWEVGEYFKKLYSKTRNETRIESIEKANDIYNESKEV